MGDENENATDRRQKLYSDTLLDHFRNPRNYGSLPSPDVAYEEFNPLCGDRVRIELKISDNRIAAARFVGDGCAICIAAASLLPSRMKCALLPLDALRSCVKIYKQPETRR
jgi:NifU-like protein involved in Fe-S cluster formation